MKQIKTGLKGIVNLDIMNSIIGQLSDGKWEDSPRMEKYWKNCDFDLDGEDVVLNITNDYVFYSYSKGKWSNEEILKWFAQKLKAVCKDEEKDNEYWKDDIHWKRDCNKESKYIHSEHKDTNPNNPTIAECYKAYDILMGRETK